MLIIFKRIYLAYIQNPNIENIELFVLMRWLFVSQSFRIEASLPDEISYQKPGHIFDGRYYFYTEDTVRWY